MTVHTRCSRTENPRPCSRKPLVGAGAGAGRFQHVVWIWLAGLIRFSGIMNPFFFSTSNLQNVLVQATVLGFLVLRNRWSCSLGRSIFRSRR